MHGQMQARWSELQKAHPLHENQDVLFQHRTGNWEPATVKQVGPEPMSYICESPTGTTFRHNRKHIQATGMPDKQESHKSCLKRVETIQGTAKEVTRSPEAHITADADTAYFAETQGLKMLGTEPAQPEAVVRAPVPQPDAVSIPVDAVPAPIALPAAARQVTDREGEEDNQGHLSGSEREDNAEESLLTPDEKVASVVSPMAPETCRSADPDSGGEDHPSEDQPRRSRRKRRARICYQPFQRKSKDKQKNQAK